MRIAILGYGKMGKEIEAIAIERNHTISHKVSSGQPLSTLTETDIAIDFSLPELAKKHISYCLENQISIVSGTTGWLEHYDEMVSLCEAKNGSFIYASNFSLGVNLFFHLNKQLAALMRQQADYKVSIEETHHTEKKDAPSGTAISLANDIIDNSANSSWSLDQDAKDGVIPINALRIPDVKGRHTITYQSEVDRISIEHDAFNRKGFALGAVIAAEWLVQRKGVFTMNDVLNIG